MAAEFSVRVLTPGDQLVTAEVTEVILPAIDGECGILSGHEDFIGLLGTGVLKLVREGDDYWYMVSSGVFEISDGHLTVLADVGEAAESVDTELATKTVSSLEGEIEGQSLYEAETIAKKTEFERARARLEAHRRTQLLN